MKLLDEYARRLRYAWLNPSDKLAQMVVHEFEHGHPQLNSYFEKWQGMGVPEVSGRYRIAAEVGTEKKFMVE